MRKAYIILAHKNPEQLNNLVDRLDDGVSAFFIHVDLKSPLYALRHELHPHEQLHMIDSLETEWGSMGLVQATLRAMKVISSQEDIFERIILLSGQDYPIKSKEEINSFYKSSPHRIFLDFSLLPNYTKWESGGGSYRINKYFFGYRLIDKYSARTLNLLAIFIPALKRKYDSVRHFYGSQWWTIDAPALNYILNYVEENPEYLNFHRFTFAPDELFFQTILLNSGKPSILNGIVNDNKVFMIWKDSSAAHPEVLGADDFHRINGSAALFARKFDVNVDEKIISLIDLNCLDNTN